MQMIWITFWMLDETFRKVSRDSLMLSHKISFIASTATHNACSVGHAAADGECWLLCVPLGCMYAASPKVCRMFILYAHFHCVLVSPSSINDGPYRVNAFLFVHLLSVVVVESGCQHSMPSNSTDGPDAKSRTKAAKHSQSDCCILAVAAAAAVRRII